MDSDERGEAREISFLPARRVEEDEDEKFNSNDSPFGVMDVSFAVRSSFEISIFEY